MSREYKLVLLDEVEKYEVQGWMLEDSNGIKDISGWESVYMYREVK